MSDFHPTRVVVRCIDPDVPKFTIHTIQSEGQKTITTDKTFLEVKQLRRALRTRFPRSEFPIKPRMPSKKGKNKVTKERKAQIVQQYLQELLDLPEVVNSEEICTFLCGTSPELPDPDSSKIRKLLKANPLSEISVSSRDVCEVEIDVPKSESTAFIFEMCPGKYDILFAVIFKGEVVRAYERCLPEEWVQDSLELPTAGKLKLVWDNTQSLMRSKSAVYRASIVPVSALEDRKEEAAPVGSSDDDDDGDAVSVGSGQSSRDFEEDEDTDSEESSEAEVSPEVLQEQVSILTTRLRMKQREMERIRSRQDRLEGEKSALNTTVEHLKEELNSVSTSRDSALQDLDAERDQTMALRQEVATQRAIAKREKQKAEEWRSRLATEQSSAKGASEELAEVYALRQRLLYDNRRLQEQLSEASEKLAVERNQSERLALELEAAKNEALILKSEVENMRDRLGSTSAVPSTNNNDEVDREKAAQLKRAMEESQNEAQEVRQLAQGALARAKVANEAKNVLEKKVLLLEESLLTLRMHRKVLVRALASNSRLAKKVNFAAAQVRKVEEEKKAVAEEEEEWDGSTEDSEHE